MKVLRDTDWTPVGWLPYLEPIKEPVYLFQHKRWPEIVALNVVKFVHVAANEVYFYNANSKEVSVSRSCHNTSSDPSSHSRRVYGG